MTADHSLARRGGDLCRALCVAFFATFSGAALAAEPPPAHLALRDPIAAPSGSAHLCEHYAWACAGPSGAGRAPDAALGRAGEINRAVNRQVPQISDSTQYGRDELWALPTARGGDCEDIALAKKKRLIEAGLPPEALLIATVLDRQRKSHAVLVLRTRSGDYVLDSLTSRMLPWQKTGYSFLRIQNPDHPNRWVGVFSGGLFVRGHA